MIRLLHQRCRTHVSGRSTSDAAIQATVMQVSDRHLDRSVIEICAAKGNALIAFAA
jgi:hypothetical protein